MHVSVSYQVWLATELNAEYVCLGYAGASHVVESFAGDSEVGAHGHQIGEDLAQLEAAASADLSAPPLEPFTAPCDADVWRPFGGRSETFVKGSGNGRALVGCSEVTSVRTVCGFDTCTTEAASVRVHVISRRVRAAFCHFHICCRS
ncbi:hypothetical protein TcWFU_008022 [Taenia crassiceps]|uniref:Uncharacterized protein n=1 Tax=Taenia crassiceps TaxID=6207 RepID=A0ABR4Q4T5_9CEST